MALTLTLAATSLLCACGGSVTASTQAGAPGSAGTQRHVVTDDFAPPLPLAWTTSLGATSALTGKIYDPAHERFVTLEEALLRVRAARVLALGEKHDNPDHHRLEAALLGESARAAEAKGEGTPAVVLEMVPTDEQAKLDLFATQPNVHARDLGAALAWDKTGWPPFAEYLPVFVVAEAHRLRLVGGDIPHVEAHAVAHSGTSGIEPRLVQRFHLGAPAPEREQKALEAEVADVHCGMLPPSFLPTMALAQRVRDASLAGAVLDARAAAGNGRVVLVSGAGHARTDRAVPALVEAAGVPLDEVLTVAFLEVDDGETAAGAYARGLHADRLPFDLVWFTPRVTDEDPCAKMVAPK